MGMRKKFSERLHGIVRELVDGRGRVRTAEALGLPNNFFAPSKYDLERFAGKHIGHLDALEEYLGVDLLSGLSSATAAEVERAEREGALSRHDRAAIVSIVRAAREHAALRGPAAVEEVGKRRRPRAKR